ncbi:MarR family transcription factor RrpA [Campylobacter jejuni]|uniref:MarR family transcription factor RrpA n=1 Tax=Campylobacter jejuni TaxID=197 RepID=UPI0011A3D591|nr:helix-turn-helix domain-containing protein [Campylobacter jejuni]
MTKENSQCNFEECGFNYTLALINGKYKMSILYCLFRYKIVRYNELKRFLSSISFKTLTNTLRELENNGLIIRKEYAQIPPKVEYSLSKCGRSLIPILQAMCDWEEENKKLQGK